MADLMCGCGKCETCLGRGPKHTPGPWTADVDSGEITAEVGAHIGMIDGEDDFERELSAEEKAECVANMHLVAAAPELLESLKTIMDGFEEGIFVRNISGDEKGDWALRLIPFIAALGKAQAAIEKAEPKGHYS